MQYKGLEITAFEQGPGKWRVSIVRANGRPLKTNDRQLLESVTSADLSSAVDALTLAMEAIDTAGPLFWEYQPQAGAILASASSGYLDQQQRVIGCSTSSASSVEGIFFAAITAVIAGAIGGLIPGIAPRAWNMLVPKSVEAYRTREEVPHCSASRRYTMLGELTALVRLTW
jgi:hypothetical protein